MKITAVIMAGGKGERFWPKSRTTMPKQFLSLTPDGETMIQKTVARLLPLVQYEDIYIVTNASYVSLVKENLPDIPDENILAEPMARNTAPCVGLAAMAIQKKYDDAIMMVLPSDHLIRYEDMYVETLKKAINRAEDGNSLVTIGITPTYPETGYGYINFGKSAGDGVYKVNRFVEKPDIEKAKEYLSSAKYLWNSGMFVWKTSSIVDNFHKFLPDMDKGLENIKNAYGTPEFESVLKDAFEGFKSESIDFGIMEKAENIYTVAGSFGWDDVGSWLALERINQTNDNGSYIEGDVITVNSQRCTITSKSRLVAAIGLEDIIIVDTDDALLVCSKDSTQDVKKALEILKKNNRMDLI